MPKEMKLGDLVNCSNGKDYQVVEAGTVPIVAISGSDYGCTNKPIHKGPLIAIGAVGTIGRARYFDKPVWITSTQVYLTIKDESVADLRFLFAMLDNLYWVNYSDPFATRATLMQDRLLNMPVILPSISEQKRMADDYFHFLSEIERTKKVIRGLKDFKTSMLCGMFPKDEPKKKVVFDILEE